MKRIVALIITALIIVISVTSTILLSYKHIAELEYVDADFEWIDDFQSYEVAIIHNNQPRYLTIKDNKVKFIYANEDFLDFVIVDYNTRIIDGKENYSIKAFYINLDYKEN